MTLSQGLQDQLCVKLRMVGLPRAVVLPIVDTITKQVAAEGPENVVSRLKILKLAAVKKMAGSNYSLDWIAHSRSGPKGVWRPVWRLLEGSARSRKRAINALMVYASLVLPSSSPPTRAQEYKFVSSVRQPDGKFAQDELGNSPKKAAEVFRLGIDTLTWQLLLRGWSYKEMDPPFIMDYLAQKHGLSDRAVRKNHRIIEDIFLRDGLDEFLRFPLVQKTLGSVWDSWTSVDPSGFYRSCTNKKVPSWLFMPPSEAPIGVIGWAQEPGMKFRAFAAPNKVLQAALEPMKRNLLAALQRLEWDCTHDQEAGVSTVQSWLREGKTVYSVDLSDATNNFPLAVQEAVMRALKVPRETLELWLRVSRSPYTVAWDKSRQLSWNVGQPLGSAPSFMAFALSHAVIALQCEVDVGHSPTGSSFRILGDDFITCDEAVHDRYRHYLRLLKAPVSEAKCLVSDQIGEFAGKVIHQDYVLHGFKYRDISDVSFLTVIRNLGSKAISPKLLTARQYEYCQLVKELPEPFGLGFNPKGVPLEDRVWAAEWLKEKFGAASKDALVTPHEILAKHQFRSKNRVWDNISPNGYSPETSLTNPYPTVDSVERVPMDKIPVKERILRKVRGSVDLLSIDPNETGDPRVDPIKGMSLKVIRSYQPAMAQFEQVRASLEVLGLVQDDLSSSTSSASMTDLAPTVLPEGKQVPKGSSGPEC